MSVSAIEDLYKDFHKRVSLQMLSYNEKVLKNLLNEQEVVNNHRSLIKDRILCRNLTYSISSIF